MSENQQIIVSGLGGQGVLFITKLLAGAAMNKDLKVLTSETHGMAQRGGIVISYLKIGDFSGPLIRPGKADALIALKQESFDHHSYLVKSDGLGVVNSDAHVACPFNAHCADATRLAMDAGSPQSVNVVMLGFFIRIMEDHSRFIRLDNMQQVIREKFGSKPQILSGVLELLESGYQLQS